MIDTLKVDTQLAILAENDHHRKDLSKSIKFLFAKLFEQENNYYCYANCIADNDYSIIHGDSEFIFDLIVVEEYPRGNSRVPNVHFIKKTVLALESELDSNLQAVLEDFQKLLVANAMEKVIVFRCHSSEFSEWIDCLTEHIKMYDSKNDERYHLIAKINDKQLFMRKTIDLIPQ